MICQPCAYAADAQKAGVREGTRCAACKRPITTYSDYSRVIMVHKAPNPDGGPRVRCPGSAKAALVTGHAACTGCDCQHKEVQK